LRIRIAGIVSQHQAVELKTISQVVCRDHPLPRRGSEIKDVIQTARRNSGTPGRGGPWAWGASRAARRIERIVRSLDGLRREHRQGGHRGGKGQEQATTVSGLWKFHGGDFGGWKVGSL